VLGRVRRDLRALRDGALHPWRRRRALRRLAAGDPPRSILFLCLGNVCRSPYAEHRFRDWMSGHAVGEIAVRSAGFIGPGRAADATAAAVARTHGVDTTGHRSVVVDRAMIKWADLIVLVDPAHEARLQAITEGVSVPTVVLGDLDPEPVRARRIRDPWGEDPAVFERVFARLDRCLDVLAETTLRAEPHG
jgi:protein-tyrosine phosphatase